MTSVELSDDGTKIEVDCTHRLSGLVREIPGSRFVPQRSLWTLPATLNAAVQLHAQLLGEFDAGPGFVGAVDLWKRAERQVSGLRAQAVDGTTWHADGRLYGYQVAAVDYLRAAGSAVLGDAPGSGKTIMALEWLHAADSALVVCPKGVQTQWLTALQERYPQHQHRLLPATAAARRKVLAEYADLPDRGALVVSYSQLPLHSRLAGYGSIRLAEKDKTPGEFNAIEWQSIIADEAHRVFNPKAQTTRALWWLADKCSRVLALTGTPAENSPLDFWALLRLVAPDEWPSRSKFQDMYCETKLNYWGGAERVDLRADTEDEFRRLAHRRFLRREKALILPHLPAKVYQAREVTLPPKLRKQYDSLHADMVTGDLVVTDPLVLYGRLVQAAVATLDVTPGEDDAPDTVRLVEPSPTLDALDETMTDLGPVPVVVMASSRQLLDLCSTRLEKNKVGHVAIVGGMSAAQIWDAVTAYNAGNVDVLLLSVGAAAEGLNLTRGSTEIWLDRHPRRLVNEQGEDRLHGTGRGDQDAEHLLIIDLVVSGTVQEQVHKRLRDKESRFQDLFGADDV